MRGSALGQKIGQRLLSAVPSVIGVVLITFLLTRALPGDPAAFFAGPAATTEAIDQVRASLGLDRSLPEQFVLYIGDLLQGDLGNSLSTGQTVLYDLTTRLPASLELTFAALVF
ncbi:MAG: ABC transporter permease, partial [Prochlorotrichaceae cyanobacterium]